MGGGGGGGGGGGEAGYHGMLHAILSSRSCSTLIEFKLCKRKMFIITHYSIFNMASFLSNI